MSTHALTRDASPLLVAQAGRLVPPRGQRSRGRSPDLRSTAKACSKARDRSVSNPFSIWLIVIMWISSDNHGRHDAECVHNNDGADAEFADSAAVFVLCAGCSRWVYRPPSFALKMSTRMSSHVQHTHPVLHTGVHDHHIHVKHRHIHVKQHHMFKT